MSQDARPVKIVATMLCGNAELIVEAAISSVVDWVDEICLIDTGVTDTTVDKAMSVAGGKIHKTTFKWCNDFAAARNAAFQIAEHAGASWVLTIDTDERLDFHGFENKLQLLEALESDRQVKAWMVPTKDRTYSKERFMRIPTSLKWHGRTHEALVGSKNGERRVLAGCHFWEQHKSQEAYQSKVERDLKILLEETASQPSDPRWWYYLGQTYEGLEQYLSAVEVFDKCIRLDQWPEESSWACYMAARCLVRLEKYREAEEYCALGMTRKPSLPELPWLAGWCCFKRGAWQNSVTWCKLAITLAQDKIEDNAATFRHMPAWYEAPYDVLRFAYRKLNLSSLAAQADVDFEVAKAARLTADFDLGAAPQRSS